jgi:hypothetical protein
LRRLLSSLGVVAATATALVALPVVSRPAVDPHPVAASVTSLPLAGQPGGRGVLADSGRHITRHFQLAGVTWGSGTLPAGAQVQLRARTHGHWSQWSPLAMPDGGPDAGSADARAAAAHHVAATEPLWVGNADGAQARVVGPAGGPVAVPTDLKVVLVDGGTSNADSQPGPPTTIGGSVASADVSQPTIYTRAQWGANESLRSRNGSDCAKPDYGSTIRMGFLHHTDNPNGYSSSSVPSIIRSIYAYHVESNGWCDIGYNFLVDRFGRIWEGRYGGITKPVIGAHTGGFNTNSFGVSMIGNFTSTTPSSAMLSAVEKLFAWKLSGYYLDPLAKTTMTAGSFSGSRYRAGTTVSFNVVSGHRDADTTTCPGSSGYGQLPNVRRGIIATLGAGLVAPSIMPASIPWGLGKSFTISAGVVASQTWTVSVTDALGNVVKALPVATASRSTPITGAWDGTDNNGLPVPPGTYTLSLSSQSGTATALPYSATVTIAPPVTVTGPSTSPLGGTVQLAGTAPPNTDVTLNLQRGDTALPAQLVHTTGPTWTASFTADDDYSWSATVANYTTPVQTTKVAPTVTSPMPSNSALFVPSGGSVQLAGTALPLAATSVHVTTTVPGAAAVTGPELPVDLNGNWSAATMTPTVPTTVVITDSRGVSSPPLTIYPVAAPTASSATAGYSARSLVVTGNAGGAPVPVKIYSKPANSSTYTLATTVTPLASGGYTAKLTLPAVSQSTPFSWKVSTGFASDVARSVTVLPAFAPTAAGPRVAHYASRLAISGKAVPGDTVTLLVRPSGGTTWRTGATAIATSASTWSASYVLRSDTEWAARTISGTSATQATAIAPTIHGPSSAPRLSYITLTGTAGPGKRVVVSQLPRGTTTWQQVAAVTTSSSGRWSARVRLVHRASYRAVSNGRASAVWSVTFS